MLNPKVEGFLITERNTSSAAAWLIGLIGELAGAAPNYALEKSAVSMAEQLQEALAYYKKHRATKDPERPVSHSRLCAAVNNELRSFIDHLGLRCGQKPVRPADEKSLEAYVRSRIAKGDWLICCAGCGNNRRIGSDPDYPAILVDETCFCAKCLDKNTQRCKSCGERHTNDKLDYVLDNIKRQDVGFCKKCGQKAGEHPRCSGCGQRYTGDPAGGSAESDITAEWLMEEHGLKLCWRCGSKWIKADCGHNTNNPQRTMAARSVEDDDRDRDHLPAEERQMVCRACATDAPGPDEPEHWPLKKPQIRGRTHAEVGSARTFGVEIEYIQTRGMHPMPEEMKAKWTAKRDDSLPGYGVEMASAILSGDLGLETIRELCQYAKEHKWAVNARAGFHLHVGLAGEEYEAVGAVALGYLRTYEMWASFVAPSRSRCRYCVRNAVTPRQLLAKAKPNEMIYLLTTANDRRVWCNWHSYNQRATIEIRIHHATNDQEKITNWIKAHTRFVDWCVKLGSAAAVEKAIGKYQESKDFRGLFLYTTQNIWKDRELGNWFRMRAAVLHGGMANVPPTNRQRKKAGLEKKQVQQAAHDGSVATISGRLVYPLQSGSYWYLTNTPTAVPGMMFLRKDGVWGNSTGNLAYRANNRDTAVFAAIDLERREAGITDSVTF